MAREKQKNPISYVDRETLDRELNSAISDILSAEETAKGILAKAQETVKAIELDGATVFRDLNKQCDRDCERERESAVARQTQAAKAECEKLMQAAQRDGEKIKAECAAKAKTLGKTLLARIGEE